MSETPKSRIVSVLRWYLWLQSKERQETIQRDKNTCQKCGVKGSKAKGKEQKIDVHHKKGEIDWDKIVDNLRKDLLCPAEDLECLCPDCHDKITYQEKKA